MADVKTRFDPGAVTDRHLRYLGAALAFVVAFLHIFHPRLGISRLRLVLSVDPTLLLSHPRPLAFVISGFAIVLAVVVVWVGAPRKPIYALGMLLMVIYILGYFAWHMTGHGGFLPDREPHFHGDLNPLEIVITHLAQDGWARTAKVVEFLLLIVLAVLYRRES